MLGESVHSVPIGCVVSLAECAVIAPLQDQQRQVIVVICSIVVASTPPLSILPAVILLLQAQ